MREPRLLPVRAIYGGVAVMVAVFALYASLLPFDFHPLPLERVWSEFNETILTTDRFRISRGNFLANLLLFVPIGFAVTGTLLIDRTRVTTVLAASAAVLPISIAVSLLAELLQIYVPARVPSRDDVVAQTLGSVIGVGAWALTGDAVTDWLRAITARSQTDRLTRALTAYAVLWTLVNLAPFDLTVDLGLLAQRVRSGMVVLRPFADAAGRPASLVVWDLVATFVSAVPLGIAGLVIWSGRSARRAASSGLAFGMLLVLAVEIAQVFILSHAADITDVLVGAAGVGGGVWAGRYAMTHVTRESSESSTASLPRLWAGAALLFWSAVVCAYHWRPFDFIVDSALIRGKLERLSLIPFAAYAAGSELNALNDLLIKLSLAVPLGIAGGLLFCGPQPRWRLLLAGWLMVTTVFFSIVEAGQLLLPSRVPDATDVFVGVAGSALGLSVARWLGARDR